jgi:putative PIN family toxin of toxin-antitoxin system
MRIVCDTNVLVSGVLFRRNPRRVLRLASQGRVENCVSPAILKEAEEVLGRPKFGLGSEAVRAIVELFQQTFTLVSPTVRVDTIVDDPDDNAILEAAAAAGAACIVSGDRHLRELEQWQGIKILSPADFLEECGAGASAQ